MIRAKRPVVAVLAALLLVLAIPVHAAPARAPKQTKAQPAQASSPQAPAQDSMMAAMQRLGTPGPEHAQLAKLAGQWKATVKMYGQPGQPPQVSEGESQQAMILGGRFLEQRFRSTMMGQPFEGYGLTGYDNATGKYWSTWVDNMSTGVMVSEGTYDPASGTMTMNATMNGPDGKAMAIRTVMKATDPNTMVYSMYPGDAPAPMMEITYTRQ